MVGRSSRSKYVLITHDTALTAVHGIPHASWCQGRLRPSTRTWLGKDWRALKREWTADEDGEWYPGTVKEVLGTLDKHSGAQCHALRGPKDQESTPSRTLALETSCRRVKSDAIQLAVKTLESGA